MHNYYEGAAMREDGRIVKATLSLSKKKKKRQELGYSVVFSYLEANLGATSIPGCTPNPGARTRKVVPPLQKVPRNHSRFTYSYDTNQDNR